MPAVDPNDPRQPYEQIADYYRSEIRAGRLKPGDRLPSGREMATAFAVAHGTAMNAMKVLRDAGLIMSWQGRGIFVRDALAAAIDPQTIDPDVAYREIVNRLDQIQIEMGQLTERVTDLEKTRRPK